MLKKIAVTGPESTGKSMISEKLAKHYHTVWVPEYAREYIAALDRPYKLEDIEQIAKGQLEREKAIKEKAQGFLFCDTELLVTKIWAEYKYGQCPEWIGENYRKQHYDLYLLMDIDLRWKPDPQREHPEKRSFFMDWFKKELEKEKRPYCLVQGAGEERLKNAIRCIEEHFNLSGTNK